MEEQSSSDFTYDSSEYEDSQSFDSSSSDEVRLTCPLCMLQTLKTGENACYLCVIFFESCVRNFYDPICSGNTGNCSFDGKLIRCYYCQINRSYAVGLTVISTYDDFSNYIDDIKSRMYAKFQNKRSDENRRFQFMLNEFPRLKRDFSIWLSSTPEFQRLSVNVQIISKDRYHLRGIIMEIVERSMEAHMVLKFDKFYWDPWIHSFNTITELMGGILLLTLRFMRRRFYSDEFYGMKLKLILKDYVDVDSVDEDDVASYARMLNLIEISMKKVLCQYKRQQWLSKMNTSN
ncbi:uncharacterized protein LOC111625591 [Centruroides sculpturatus]|uniref:uncharacterized protein LOC111625591 n=1 Tax=Centruroides sculpturatus TaxID=218467 RepID=UPI000C6EDD06|nr:uncharacterized protein LOC111625591 [Centruroides sculpturatus]XP_023224546.1 uncharacterized protein LOC111625591 [Centruroides sculpturatus]